MAITNKYTLEKMKKKNKKSIVVNKETGTITQGGKTYKNKEDYKKNKPASKKNTGSIFESPRSKAIRLSTESGKANRAASDKMKAAEKKYAKESMFAKAADNRDKKKTEIAPKGSIKKKSTLDADTRKSYEKRVAWMKKRKAAGKNFSAKNLAELEAKLK